MNFPIIVNLLEIIKYIFEHDSESPEQKKNAYLDTFLFCTCILQMHLSSYIPKLHRWIMYGAFS